MGEEVTLPLRGTFLETLILSEAYRGVSLTHNDGLGNKVKGLVFEGRIWEGMTTYADGETAPLIPNSTYRIVSKLGEEIVRRVPPWNNIFQGLLEPR